MLGAKRIYTILQNRFNFKLFPIQILIFVNNANFYVNIIMLTTEFSMHFDFIIFDFPTICCVVQPLSRSIS